MAGLELVSGGLGIDVNSTLGAQLVGTLIAILLFGLVTCQGASILLVFLWSTGLIC